MPVQALILSPTFYALSHFPMFKEVFGLTGFKLCLRPKLFKVNAMVRMQSGAWSRSASTVS